ncbi:ribosomal protein S18 acetylase RimI-like enzyme [Paenibacillus methanolicus]|uniref:Ribosomal protein S18 acetylase RimI-like enzyme n=1 Tax=Paenibacillus methanolicus TaxID=582686 RepID=A0A5S5BR74_9BACL|nr:GNAT family N-acetyltransferase [Paenibacillus methanolicus]TYP69589.1 ribosomal protein S18 acetylase RimI-like enzyme [Paenibacillus methanolicus]
MEGNLKLRPAAETDWPLVHRLIIEAFREYEGVLVPQSGALRETVASIRETVSGRGGALIAETADGSAALGTALHYVVEKHLYVGRVSVVPAARGQGVGKALMLEMERIAREAGLAEIRVSVRLSLPDNVAFYERLGYEAFDHVFYPDRTDSWYEMRKRLGAALSESD